MGPVIPPCSILTAWYSLHPHMCIRPFLRMAEWFGYKPEHPLLTVRWRRAREGRALLRRRAAEYTSVGDAKAGLGAYYDYNCNATNPGSTLFCQSPHLSRCAHTAWGVEPR